MTVIDRQTHRLSRFSLYVFWSYFLHTLAFCAYIGVNAFKS